MRLSETLLDNGIIINTQSTSKDQVLREMVDTLVQAYDLKHGEEILTAVFARESTKSTGIGCGLAVPHAKVDYVDRMCMVAATVEKGIAFDTMDREPVYLILLMISPSNTVGPHIKALSSVARLIADANVRNLLIKSKTVEEFLGLMREAEGKFV